MWMRGRCVTLLRGSWVVAMVTDRDGAVYEGVAGVRRLGGDDPMTLDTVFALFSCTKAITATAALQLVEEGRLDLDAPAHTYAPEIAERQVLDGFEDVVTGTSFGSTHVVAFSGRTGGVILSFFAFEGFLGGVRLGVGDLDGDGGADVAVVAGPGGNGHVKAFAGWGSWITSIASSSASGPEAASGWADFARRREGDGSA